MENDDEGLAGALYQPANEAEQLSRRIRAQSVVLRHAHERSESQKPLTQSVVEYCQPLSLETATQHVPLCHRTNQPHPLSSCLGCHPEGE